MKDSAYRIIKPTGPSVLFSKKCLAVILYSLFTVAIYIYIGLLIQNTFFSLQHFFLLLDFKKENLYYFLCQPKNLLVTLGISTTCIVIYFLS